MKKTIIELILLISFISLFFVPAGDKLSSWFIFSKAAEISVFVLAGKAYDKATKKA